MMKIDASEALGLYVFLKSRESETDSCLGGLLTRIERLIYDKLSVEELENITEVYRKHPDILKSRE